ncbi:YqeG family HAD IIIA-type phosphatase [Caldibacillus debilis]|nr:YqeG family HAD IIIA-type phosphatase [Caldibacillus debilis]
MWKKFLPNDFVPSVRDISPEYLKKREIQGIITDLDNTLVEWDRPLATPDVRSWMENMKAHGIRVVIVSNNSKKRVFAFADPLNVPFVCRAKKPLGKSFRKALEILDLPKEKVAVVGDQLLTDIYGGNRSGFFTILVVPVAQSDGFMTKINRMIERKLFRWFEKKGLFPWKEGVRGKSVDL